MDAAEDRIRNEEYKIWKKNTPFLYDYVQTQPLEWTSLTVQWLPTYQEDAKHESSFDINSSEKKKSSGKSVCTPRRFTKHKVVLGTFTDGGAMNQLMIGNVKIPDEVSVDKNVNYNQDLGEFGGYSDQDMGTELSLDIKINHEGEINRARYCPHNPNLIATKSPSSNVYLFDYTKHPNNPKDPKKFCPEMTLTGHSGEGYGLAWSTKAQGSLLSCGEDKKICYWDINAIDHTSSDGKRDHAGKLVNSSSNMHANQTFLGHSDYIEDVAWHSKSPTVFGSVGDDKNLMIWDLKTANSPVHKVGNAHNGSINSISFNPWSDFIFATGSDDENICLWDLRNLKIKLHTFESHNDAVFNVSWCPQNETILASASVDRRVMVWDLARIGEEQSHEEMEDGPPELLFIHGGHTSKVADIDWNYNTPWLMASTGEDNQVQFWQMAENIYEDVDIYANKENESSKNSNNCGTKVSVGRSNSRQSNAY